MNLNAYKMITTIPKTPNNESAIDGGPKSAFKCVQRRCRSPPNLSSGNMINSVTLQSSSAAIKHSSDVLHSAANNLDKHNMFPQFYIPSNLLCSTSNQQTGQDETFADILKFRMNNNKHLHDDCKNIDDSSSNPSKRIDQMEQLAHLHSRLSSTTQSNVQFDTAAKDFVQNQMQLLDTNRSTITSDTIYDAIGGGDQRNIGINAVPNFITQNAGLNRISNMMYQGMSEEECSFATRVPATTQSDKCQQRARAILQQHNQSPEKIRRYK